jgi:hypothetical protein
MPEGNDTVAVTPHPRAQRAQSLIQQLALVALLGVCLGFIMQAVVIIARILGGGVFPGATLLADIVQTVTWSWLVCTGVTIGVAVGKGRKALAGLVGLLFAPVALAAAKAAQRAVLAIIEAIEQPATVPLATAGVVRAIEYGLLAYLLARLTERRVLRPRRYIATGLAIGLSFGVVLVWLTYRSMELVGKAPTTAQLLGLVANEIGTPTGCAIIIYVAQLASYSARVYSRHATDSEPRGGMKRAG